MLAEIFLVRLQTLVRSPVALSLPRPARDPRFVPIKLPRK
jgi:hypothetical protein